MFSSAMGVIKRSASEFSTDGCATMAAALAYYTAFSLPPLMVLIVTVAGWFWSPEAVTGKVEQQVSSVVGEGGWTQIESMMQSAGEQNRGPLAAIVGIVVLLLGATGVMVQLQAALNTAWGVQPDPEQGGVKNFIVKRMLSLGMILAVAFLLIVSLVLTSVLNAASGYVTSALQDAVAEWVPVAINFAVSMLVFALLFAAMFKWLPDAEVRWSDTWRGALVTALFFMLGKLALGLYFANTNMETYGAAASFVLLLLWAYYSGMIFLFGAELTRVWSQHRGADIVPSAGAIRVPGTKSVEAGSIGQKSPAS